MKIKVNQTDDSPNGRSKSYRNNEQKIDNIQEISKENSVKQINLKEEFNKMRMSHGISTNEVFNQQFDFRPEEMQNP